MKVYRMNGERGPHRLHVTPGFFRQDVSEWMQQDGKTPVCFVVVFKDGMAEVPDSLGKYMLDEKLVQRSPLILSDTHQEQDEVLDFTGAQHANT
jgi:hypothetical protein